MGCVIFGDDKTPAGVFVETMNDAWPLLTPNSRQRRAMIEQRVNQSVSAMTGARVNDKPCRLIDDDQIVVFEQNLKRNCLWQNLNPLQRRLDKLNLIATANNLAWPDDRAVESNKPVTDQLLKP
jgi:hypothetical protein